jgi:hypothetical protein
MTIRIPSFLHEAFGETQSAAALLTIGLFGLGLTVGLFLAYPEMAAGLPWWRSLLAGLLIADIFAGCLANFTRSTNDYCAARSRARLVFIAVHVHLLAVAWLLGVGGWQAVLVWAYTIIGALVVNALAGGRSQVFVAGALLCAGLALAILSLPAPPYFLLIAALFLVKVLYSFAVDHYGQARGDSAAQKGQL